LTAAAGAWAGFVSSTAEAVADTASKASSMDLTNGENARFIQAPWDSEKLVVDLAALLGFLLYFQGRKPHRCYAGNNKQPLIVQ